MRRISITAFRIARRGTSREINRQIALNLVRAKQPVSRADLARLMGVRRGAVTRLVDELLEAGLVFEGAKGESRRGRKPTHLHIETRRRCVVAVDVSASVTSVLVTDLLGHPLVDVTEFPTRRQQPARVQELARGLGTCWMNAVSICQDFIKKALNLASDLILVDGIAVGYPVQNSPLNQLPRHRLPVEEVTEFR